MSFSSDGEWYAWNFKGPIYCFGRVCKVLDYWVVDGDLEVRFVGVGLGKRQRLETFFQIFCIDDLFPEEGLLHSQAESALNGLCVGVRGSLEAAVTNYFGTATAEKL